MANNKMLIDASHPEETRVVVLRGNRIEEFDFESASKKPLRGNIYLAKVTRVEPSLQAAFVEYGGNRHGFLAFSEIHPDYYQIPVADRLALLEEEAREQREEAAEEENRSNRRNRRRRGPRPARRATSDDETLSAEAPDGDETEVAQAVEDGEAPHDTEAGSSDGASMAVIPADDGQPTGSEADATGRTESAASDAPVNEQAPVAAAETPPAVTEASPAGASDITAPSPEVFETAPAEQSGEPEAASPEETAEPADRIGEPEEQPGDEAAPGERETGEDEDEDEEDEEENVEQLGGDGEEEMPRQVRRSRRQYKIQEVIKRRQIMLIQVVKEERGNKGAALTTYLSLAGRYSVLMPNTARGGGISRKITDGDDRRRMKEIAQDLEVPDGMGVILRTAGASRDRIEIRRDFEYLLRLWESVREMTLNSTAPALVYEEGSLIKRSIRDLYGREIDEVVVAGDEGYREAKDFMRMLMPSHAKNVRQWREPQPVFAKSGVEQQLDSLFSPAVTLKSGGYIVINQTEALVAIDVNSGRSTREHNIEDTALRTNLEAADEIARQLRLRDLAGLIVVDFIDMEEHRNNRSVERRLKEALKSDRARIQVGRISHFGLLEMSRQRMRTGVLEGSSIICPHCQGAGTVRSTASIALHVLRLIEDALIRNNNFNLTVKTRSEVALYILNQKRSHVAELEQRFGIALTIDADDSMTGTTYHAIERGEPATAPVAASSQALQFSSPAEAETDDEEGDIEAESIADEETADNGASDTEASEDGGRRRRRRRRRGRDRTPSGIEAEAPQPSDEGLSFMAGVQGDAPASQQNGDELVVEQSDQDTAIEGDGDDEASRREPRSRRGFRRRRRGQRAAGEDENALDETSGDPGEVSGNGQDDATSTASPRAGSWVKSSEDVGEALSSEPAQEETQSAQSSEPMNGEAIRSEPPAPTPIETAVRVEDMSAPQGEANENDQPAGKSAAANAPETKSAEEPEPRRPTPAPLPEAPPPDTKRSGWWSRPR